MSASDLCLTPVLFTNNGLVKTEVIIIARSTDQLSCLAVNETDCCDVRQ